jgi:hypothetical protein
MFYEKLVSLDIHIEVLIGKSIIGIIRSNYTNLHEIMCTYVAKYFEKDKQLV